MADSLSERRYWAFISHSHADARWATWLHGRLESYRVPRQLVGRETLAGTAPRQFRPIFRDRAELAAHPDLPSEIHRVIDACGYLIVVCSPAAARSDWVNAEIAYFISVHGDGRILCVIVDGTPSAALGDRQGVDDCFPPALNHSAPGRSRKARTTARPIAADLRPGGDGRRLALLKLLAGMLNVGLDDLVHRDARRRQQQLAGLAAASFAGMVAMGGLTVAALRARNEAEQQRAQAEGLIEFMLGDLRKTLEPAGKLDALSAVGQRAMAYYAAQPTGRLDADSLGRRSRVLHLIGDVEDKRGDLDAALTDFRAAARSTGALLARKQDDPQRIFDHAQSVYWVGYIAWRHGKADEARRQFLDYKTLADRLVAIDPKNDAWQAEVGYANANLGTVLLGDGRANEAVAAFGESLAIKQQLVARKPGDRDLLADLGQGFAGRADAELMSGDLRSALADRTAERRIYLDLLSSRPGEPDTTESLIVNRHAVAKILLQQDRTAEAITELELATRSALDLIKTNPGNTQFRQRLPLLYLLLGQAQIQSGRLAAASESAHEALDTAESLSRADPTVSNWSGVLLGGARVLDINVRARRATSRSDLIDVLSNSDGEFRRLAQISLKHARDLSLARTTAEAAILAGDHAWLAGDIRGARQTWGAGVDVLLRAGVEEPAHKSDRARLVLTQLRTRPRTGPTWASGPQSEGKASAFSTIH